MRIDVKNNTKKGVIFGTIHNIVSLLTFFIIQTIIIRKLGPEYVGIKGLFKSILTVLNLAELGFGCAIVFSMYKPIADEDIDTISALLNTYKKAYYIVGLTILGIGLLLMPVVPYLIKGTYPQDINIYLVYFLFLIDSALSYMFYAYKQALLSAYQRTDVISKFNIFILLIMNFIGIVLLLLTSNFYIYLLSSLSTTIVRNIVLSKVVDRMYPEIKAKGEVSTEFKKEIKGNVSALLLANICSVSRNSFDSIFISMFIGLTQTAIYSNYFCIMAAVSTFTQIVLSSLLAGIGNNIVLNSVKENYKMMIIINKFYIVLCGILTTFMLCLYQPFMSLWVGEKLLYENYIMILFPIYFYLLRIGDIRMVYSNAAGLFKQDRLRIVIETIMNIILNYLFVKQWGVFGVLLATIITIIFSFITGAMVLFKHYLKASKFEYFKNELVYMVCTAVCCLLTYFICTLFNSSDIIFVLLIRILICLVCTPLIYYVLLHITGDYLEIKEFIISIRKR